MTSRGRPDAARAVALVAWLSACGGGGAPPAGTPAPEAQSPPPRAVDEGGLRRGLTPPERFVFEKLFRDAERVRGLPFLRPVPVEVRDREAIEAYIRAELTKDDLATDALLYTTLGLLPADMDVAEMLVGVMGEQIVGYYDTERAHFVVRDDVVGELRAPRGPLGESRMVIVHEMVHALQDQHLGLAKNFPGDRDADAAHAYQAVVEGDATLAMLAYVAETLGGSVESLSANQGLLDGFLAQADGVPGQERLSEAPAIVRLPLLWAYMRGLSFCAAAHGRGRWAAVNALHRDPPASTEQLQHPEKYARRETPVAVALPALPALEAAGYRVVKEDTLGELELSVYLAAPGKDQHEPAAAGWGGDRLRLYRAPDGRGAAAWKTVWDTDRDAREAEAAARARGGEGRTPATVRRTGRTVWFLHNLPPDLTDAALTK